MARTISATIINEILEDYADNPSDTLREAVLQYGRTLLAAGADDMDELQSEVNAFVDGWQACAKTMRVPA